MPCSGNGDDHCCWHESQICIYLRENEVEGRRWSCALYTQYGDWDSVLASTEYQTNIQPFWDKYKWNNVLEPNLSCKTWPPPGRTCNGCGYTGE